MLQRARAKHTPGTRLTGEPTASRDGEDGDLRVLTSCRAFRIMGLTMLMVGLVITRPIAAFPTLFILWTSGDRLP